MAAHTKIQVWCCGYVLLLSILALVYCAIVVKHKSRDLVTAISCFFVSFAIMMVYAWSLMGDQSHHDWIQDHYYLNKIAYCIGLLGYGYGMYIISVRQWMTAWRLPLIIGPGVGTTINSSEVENFENLAEDETFEWKRDWKTVFF